MFQYHQWKQQTNVDNDRKQMRVHPEGLEAVVVVVTEAATFIILYHHHLSPCSRKRRSHFVFCRHRHFFLLDK